MNVGDIVTSNAYFRQERSITANHSGWQTDLGIVRQITPRDNREHDLINVQYSNGSARNWSRNYLEVRHPLESHDARAYHVAYPQYDEQTWNSCMAAHPNRYQPVQDDYSYILNNGGVSLGARVRVTLQHDSAYGTLGTLTGFEGDASHPRVYIVELDDPRLNDNQNARFRLRSSFELVPVTDLPTPITPILQAGDMVLTHDMYGWEGTNTPVLVISASGHRLVVQDPVNGRHRGATALAATFHSRITGHPITWKIGDKVRRVRGTLFLSEMAIGEEGYVTDRPTTGFLSSTTQNFIVSKKKDVRPGHGFYHVAGDYELIVEEMPTQEYRFPVWVSLEGVTQEEHMLFLDALDSTGMTFNPGGKGMRERPDRTKGNGLVIGYDNTQYLYYTNDNWVANSSVNNLKENWNGLLLGAEKRVEDYQGTKKKAVVEKPAEPKPVKRYMLEHLPSFFILEEQGEKPLNKQSLAIFQERYKMRGTLGKYTLFSNNTFFGTSLPGVAEAFQRQHQCIRLQSKDDAVLIAALFQQHKELMNNTSASQKFAIDTAASGPHLLQAFHNFMQSIGYRQENAEKSSGPFILVNGGNIHSNQPATWQYSDVKNNRNATFDLTVDWDKMSARISNNGAALPVLDTDDLERPLAVGDEVLVIDTSAGGDQDKLILRKFVQGTTYKIKSLSGDQAVMTNGYMLSVSRLQLLETPKGLQNGDLVILTKDTGDYLKAGMIFTIQSGKLLDEKGNTFGAPQNSYEALTPSVLRDQLLAKAKLTLPVIAQITNPAAIGYGTEVVLNDAWALNNQQLGFWTEAGSNKEAWYELGDFAVVSRTQVGDIPVRIQRGATPAATTLVINGVALSLVDVEKAIAEAVL